MADKPYHEMTDQELTEALGVWEANVGDAAGWSSAYFAATELKAIVAEGQRRGLGFLNKLPVTRR